MYASHLSCPKCDATYESENLIQLCKCGAPLLVDYDLPKVQAVFKKEMLKDREPNLWRYRELLPVKEEKNIVCLGEGMTPLLPLKRFCRNIPNRCGRRG
jgi:threonine synthase